MSLRWTEQQLAEYEAQRVVGLRPFGASNPPFKLPGNEAGAFALGRLPRGAMNRTEARYAAHLSDLQVRKQILWFKFEALKLRLADNTFYTPDFFVMRDDCRLECHEVKGFWQDDARVKIKVAAATYPFRFIAVTARTKKNGGGWNQEEFS